MHHACVEDLREAARRRLPRIFFDYIDGASFSEQTAHANIADFGQWQLIQRVLVDRGTRDFSTTFLGHKIAHPFVLGPVGFSGLFAARGEVLAARAAHQAGIPFCLSNFGIVTLEELRVATDGPLWFQLYVLKDRSLANAFIDRARNAGVDVLCVTVDCAVGAVRERDVRSGFLHRQKITPKLALALMTRPGWLLRVARAGIPRIGHLSDHPEFGKTLLEQAVRLGGQMDPAFTWEDILRVRDRWKGKLVIKGIMHPDDARLAVEAGADGIVVSNHGGRELDSSPSTISALPAIAAAVGDRTDVLLDSGIRRGTHIVKALALGAKGVLLGRAYAYGLAAAGEDGVTQVIRMLATEVDATLALMGHTSIESLRRNAAQSIIPKLALAGVQLS